MKSINFNSSSVHHQLIQMKIIVFYFQKTVLRMNADSSRMFRHGQNYKCHHFLWHFLTRFGHDPPNSSRNGGNQNCIVTHSKFVLQVLDKLNWNGRWNWGVVFFTSFGHSVPRMCRIKGLNRHFGKIIWNFYWWEKKIAHALFWEIHFWQVHFLHLTAFLKSDLKPTFTIAHGVMKTSLKFKSKFSYIINNLRKNCILL